MAKNQDEPFPPQKYCCAKNVTTKNVPQKFVPDFFLNRFQFFPGSINVSTNFPSPHNPSPSFTDVSFWHSIKISSRRNIQDPSQLSPTLSSSLILNHTPIKNPIKTAEKQGNLKPPQENSGELTGVTYLGPFLVEDARHKRLSSN